jgi:hypothetical protein
LPPAPSPPRHSPATPRKADHNMLWRWS